MSTFVEFKVKQIIFKVNCKCFPVIKLKIIITLDYNKKIKITFLISKIQKFFKFYLNLILHKINVIYIHLIMPKLCTQKFIDLFLFKIFSNFKLIYKRN